jgi:hypothetical protein
MRAWPGEVRLGFAKFHQAQDNQAKESPMAKDPAPAPTPAGADKPIEEQAREQAGQQVQLRIDEAGMETTYANAFRTNGTAEEVILDFGLNLIGPAAQPQAQPQILFKVNQRVVMNYYSVKRLAITLSQLIRRHEEQFGELEMDVTKRRK